MVLNGAMGLPCRRKRVGVACAALCALVGLSACGGEKYRYVESDDGHMFVKIPKAWNVESEGAVDFRFIAFDYGTDIDFAFTRGDSTTPWRAEFAADGDPGEVPSGQFETQHLDARVRDQFLLSQHIDSFTEQFGATGLKRTKVALGDLEGYRVTYTVGADDDAVEFDEVYLIDDRRSGVYIASVNCSADCMQRYDEQIDEVLTGFWVEL
jgi:hypothetical protein